MKPYIFLFLLFVTSIAYGQSTSVNQHRKAAYFIDSIRVSSASMGSILPENIKDVNVSKDFVDKENNVYGAIYITTKNPNTYNFIGLDAIKKAYQIVTSGLTIYMVDKEFIQDTQYFKLPSSLIYSVNIIKGSEFDNLKNDFPNLSIVKITTKANAPKSGELIIRGASF